MIRKETCRGCKDYTREECDLPNEKGDCPCTECLVKMMCDYGCDEFLEWGLNGHRKRGEK